ncbi:MAG: hypothetical protein JNM34_04050 [Chthonomonadaceae bacterium]|jgi:biopolymer transport protein ExbB/TolQ|nr:hypothetical protein [Chthonomonadaceae bacterium]
MTTHRKIMLTALVTGSILGLAMTGRTWREFEAQKVEARKAREDMKSAERQRADVAKLVAKYDSQIGKESLARENGYRKADEVPVESLK